MRLKILKCGSYSFSPIGTPFVTFEEKDIDTEKDINITFEQAEMLVADRWAEFVIEGEENFSDQDSENDENDENDEQVETWETNENDFEPGESELEDDYPDSQDDGIITEEKLIDMISGANEKEAKQILQDWGIVNLDKKINKSFTVVGMIERLIQEARNQD